MWCWQYDPWWQLGGIRPRRPRCGIVVVAVTVVVSAVALHGGSIGATYGGSELGRSWSSNNSGS